VEGIIQMMQATKDSNEPLMSMWMTMMPACRFYRLTENRMAQIKKRPLLSGLLILFLAAMIFANIGGNMYQAFMPLYLKDLGANIPQIGLFFTLAQIVPSFPADPGRLDLGFAGTACAPSRLGACLA
jgi:hypothetical protein